VKSLFKALVIIILGGLVLKTASEILVNLSTEEKKIFNLLQKQGSMSKNEILGKTKMKLTTLNNVMRPLEKSKIIVEKAIGESSGGRKPTIYDINPCKLYSIGIDISRLYSQVVITNLGMEILYKEKFYMDFHCTPDETVRRIVEIINKAYVDMRLDFLELLGVGLGTVGPLNRKDGIMRGPIEFLATGWVNVPIIAMLEDKLGCKVIIENGANSAVIGEYLYGIGRGTDNIAYFNCGANIRTGIVSSGKIIRALDDEEDAFGHMIIEKNGKECRCGNSGCIGAYASINSIVKSYAEEIKKGRHADINKQSKDIGFIEICLAAEEKDELAEEIITAAAVAFGIGLVNYINLLNPKVVILSGPLIEHSSLFYEVCKKVALNKFGLVKEKRVVFSRGGHFKENAISVGASALVIERYLESGI
jgi:predicted NBD/HSP70 family sugar kinase